MRLPCEAAAPIFAMGWPAYSPADLFARAIPVLPQLSSRLNDLASVS